MWKFLGVLVHSGVIVYISILSYTPQIVFEVSKIIFISGFGGWNYSFGLWLARYVSSPVVRCLAFAQDSCCPGPFSQFIG